MKKIAALMCLAIAGPPAQAQETNEVGQLKQRMQPMQDHFEQVHQEDRELINELSRKVETLAGAHSHGWQER